MVAFRGKRLVEGRGSRGGLRKEGTEEACLVGEWMLMRRGMESEGSLFGEKVEWFGADLGFNWEDDSFLGLGRDAVCTSSGVDFRREGEVEGEEQEGGFGGREEYGGLTRENAWEIGDLLEKFLEEGGLGEESGFDAVGSSGVGLGADISNYYGPSLTSLNEEELTSYGVHEDAGVYEATQEVCAASKPVQLGRVKNKREVKILQRAHHPGSALPSKEAAELSVDKRLRILERGDRDAVDEELDRYGRRDRRKFISRSQRPESFEVPATEGGLYKTDGQPQFASMENLTAELKGIAVQEVKEKACKCTSCGKSFARKCVLKFVWHHSFSTSMIYLLEFFFPLHRYTLIQHMRIHSNERTHKCPVEGCGKQFVQKANLSQHMRYHTGEK